MELKENLIKLVLEYTTQMNEIESKYFKSKDFDGYGKEYTKIFEKYCTNKKRAYGGRADSFGEPTKYDGIEKSINHNTELKTKSRAEVYFKTKNNFDAEYLFIVLKKSGEWKIDSYKRKWFGAEKWTNELL